MATKENPRGPRPPSRAVTKTEKATDIVVHETTNTNEGTGGSDAEEMEEETPGQNRITLTGVEDEDMVVDMGLADKGSERVEKGTDKGTGRTLEKVTCVEREEGVAKSSIDSGCGAGHFGEGERDGEAARMEEMDVRLESGRRMGECKAMKVGKIKNLRPRKAIRTRRGDGGKGWRESRMREGRRGNQVRMGA